MKTLIKLIVVAVVLGLTGCQGANYRPIIDTATSRSNTGNSYETDLNQCQGYAAQINPTGEAAGSAVTGAAVGAAFGAVLGAILGVNVGKVAAVGAATGGAQGAISGVSSGYGDQREVVRRCMSGRGYSVLR